MRSSLQLPVLLVLSMYLGAVPIIYHDIPGGQDPYAHITYANQIFENRDLTPENYWIEAGGLDSFPVFHILFGGLKAVTGFGDWGVYGILSVFLTTLVVYFLFRIGASLFDDRVGLLAGFLVLFSFFFLSHIYNIGLTYNLLLVLEALMVFSFFFEGRLSPLYIMVFLMAATHVYSLIPLLVLLILARRNKPLAAATFLATLYPLGVVIPRALESPTLWLTALRNPLGVYYSYVLNIGAGALLNILMFGAFFLAGIYFVRVDKRRYGPMMIWTGMVAFFWFLVSFPYMSSRGFTLYETDRFLFYAVFPLAVVGAAAFFEVGGKYQKGLLVLFILVSGTSAFAMVGNTIKTPYAVEESLPGLMVLSEVVDEDVVVITNELQWVAYYTDCETHRLMAQVGTQRISLFETPEALYRLSGEDLFSIMDNSPDSPRYIFLGKNDLALRGAVIEWFIQYSDEGERFDIAYYDGGSMIVRVVYFDNEYALSSVLALADGPVEVAIVDSFDADPENPGEESWIVRMQVAGEMFRYIVSKETGEVALWT